MSKNIAKKSLIAGSILLGIMVSLQYKSLYINNNGMTTSKRGEQLSLELKKLKSEENNLNQEIENIKKDIEKYENETADDAIKKEVDEMRILAGYTDIEGKGIEIRFLKDEESSNLTYNYDLILSVINKLNSAQALAIEINGNRLISQSYLNVIEDDLYINESKIMEPIVIKAIGNPETLASSIEIKYGIAWEIEKYYNYEIEVTKLDNLLIKGYDKKENHIENSNGGN